MTKLFGYKRTGAVALAREQLGPDWLPAVDLGGRGEITARQVQMAAHALFHRGKLERRFGKRNLVEYRMPREAK